MNVERRGHASVGPEHEQARLSAHEGSPWGPPDPYHFFRGRQDDDGEPSPLAPLVVVVGIPTAILFWGAVFWFGWRMLQ
jgi:hypothetical protein